MGNLSLSQHVMVFEQSNPVCPDNGEITITADNGAWNIQHNTAECASHISIYPQSGSSDCTVSIASDGTPHESGWSLNFYLDNILKETLDLIVYAEAGSHKALACANCATPFDAISDTTVPCVVCAATKDVREGVQQCFQDSNPGLVTGNTDNGYIEVVLPPSAAPRYLTPGSPAESPKQVPS